jgi:hypothetical protein
MGQKPDAEYQCGPRTMPRTLFGADPDLSFSELSKLKPDNIELLLLLLSFGRC